MVATLGEAYSLGWRVKVYCGSTGGGMKRARQCIQRAELDLETLVWTRGKDFPLTRLESRLKCVRCGNRHLMVSFEPPPVSGQVRAAG